MGTQNLIEHLPSFYVPTRLKVALVPPHLRNVDMRRIAATAVLGALACLLPCCPPLLAKPTRTIGRSAARLTAPPPTLRSSRSRTAQPTTAGRRGTHPDPHSSASRSPRLPESSRTLATAPIPPHLRGSKRERALAAQTSLAARTAILSADRKGRRGRPSHSGGAGLRASHRAAAEG